MPGLGNTGEKRPKELSGAHRVLGVQLEGIIPSSLGWEVRLSCLCVVAGLDCHGQGIELSL